MTRGKIPVEGGLLANRATSGVIGGYRDRNEVEKIDCRANGEVVF